MGKKKNQVHTETKEDPVSQLKTTLSSLSQRVGKMGSILGVEPTSTPQNGHDESQVEKLSQKMEKLEISNNSVVDVEENNKYERPDMTQEEKKTQRAAKAAEKKARAEAAAAKKAGASDSAPTTTSETPKLATASTKHEFERPDMSQEEKKAQRAAKAAEKKKRAEEAAAKKAAGGNSDPLPKKKEQKDQKTTEQPSEVVSNGVIPNVDKPCPKSALKTVKSDREEKEVKFDMSSAMCSSLENLPTTPSTDDYPCFSGLDISHIHPAFQGLATRCDKGLLYEVDELCTEFLTAFKEYYSDWLDTRAKEGSDPKTVGLDLTTAIRPQIGFLTQDGKWPLPSALGNLVRQLKKEISKLAKDNNPELLIDWIDCVLKDNFETAYLAISGHLQNKLTASRTIMTYSSYHVVETLFKEHKEKNLSCCVVDPELNGRGLNLVKSLSKEGVKMIYTDLKSSAFAMQRCSMVLLGCSAVLSNGNVTSARGSLQLALTAKAFNVPVLVLSQSFKFIDKVQSSGRMALLRRDADEVVPADLITAVVTDIRILPPSSAPAVLKAKDIELR